MLILTVIQGPDKGKRFELPDNEPQLIGRSSEALPLTDTTISRRHAELTPDEGQWIVNDLQSANGTFVNGQKIDRPTRLRSGDQIRTGASVFLYGRASLTPTRPVQVIPSDHIESAVQRTAPSNEESVILAVPDPAHAASIHLRILYELMQLVGTNFEQQSLIERVMELIFEHFRADRGFILLSTGPGLPPEPVVVRYRREPAPGRQQSITISRTIVQHVIEKAEGVLSSNAMVDSRFTEGDSIQAYGIRSTICVPVKFRQRVFGVIYVDSLMANYTFTEDQLRLLTAIGAQTGMALENAELYQKGLQQARLIAVGETVASLSHSIRNILQAMRGGAEVIELGLRKKDLAVVTGGWDVLSRNLERIFDLTMNMLAFSKQRRPEFELYQVNKLLKEIAELIQIQAEKRGVKLLVKLDPDMPPIPLDTGGLHQAIVNLLHNALDAVQPEIGQIKLTSRYNELDHAAIITISDNGSGIDPESLAHIFEPFYSTKGLRGTGLGLAVTKKIIDEHGGQITVQSAPSRGSTFTIQLSSDFSGDPAATTI